MPPTDARLGVCMRTKTLILARKASIRTGEWKRGPIPRAQWPSRRAKDKAYKYGPRYQWRIISFLCLGYECRVRILLNIDARILRATFAVTEDGDTKALCDYEWHASEPGWHCHARCGHVEDVDATKNRFGSIRMPAWGSYHRRQEFKFGDSDLNEIAAFNFVVTLFRIREGGGLI